MLLPSCPSRGTLKSSPLADPCCRRLPHRLVTHAVVREKHHTTSELDKIPKSALPFPSRVTAMSKMSLGRRGKGSRAASPGSPLLFPETMSETSNSSREEMLPDSKTSLHFAYGQGLHFETLKSSGVKVLSRDGCFVSNERVALVFRHRGGQATLQQLEQGEEPKYMPYGHQVHGVLYRLTKKDMALLAEQKEGYHLKQFEVELYDGRTATALAFVSSPHELLPKEVVPPEGYMKLLREGSADQVIDPIYQAWLSSIDTVCGCGLGPDYFNTQSTHVKVGLGFVASVSLLTAGFMFMLP